MARWTCPRCDREFERPHQSHTCVTGGTVDDTFAGRPENERAVYDAIADHLASLGEVHVDAVQVGVFLKRSRKFAEVRPMKDRVSLDLVLPRTVHDPRITKTISISADRIVHVIRLGRVEAVDETVRDWLTEAFWHASD